jgi:hypothetical protein
MIAIADAHVSFAAADLTLANPNVFYEVGVRHAARPETTVLIVAKEERLPFDVAMLRTLLYRLGADGRPSHAAEDAEKLGTLLNEGREHRAHDSPLYQLLNGFTPLSVPGDRTDVFRDQVAYRRPGRLNSRRRGRSPKLVEKTARRRFWRCANQSASWTLSRRAW